MLYRAFNPFGGKHRLHNPFFCLSFRQDKIHRLMNPSLSSLLTINHQLLTKLYDLAEVGFVVNVSANLI